MRYNNITEGIFIKRPNRFIAEVEIDGSIERVHVKNTGRLRELLKEGTPVLLEESDKPERKTRYSLIAVYKGSEIVNIDSQAPNKAAYEALKAGKIAEIGKPDAVKSEVTYGGSRFDLYYEKDGKKGFAEVKGVTLDVGGTARFPDAPTERGTKHVRELIKAKAEGYECSILFVIQMNNISLFEPNYDTDPKFAEALAEAAQNGVNVLAYDCVVDRDSMVLDGRVAVKIAETE
ncbi:MAG: DNA/RNA nuclease SfsA [Clostridiales bacterium]|nr:DNA/RNA nuclease SfsA [Clostridiales bacterium]